ncbi:MAG: DUF4394 domain-containing protein [Acidimicrobiales bacterium]|nr:DUF4394 domain-containing protein [Acidimicrobiales bacterium]
MNQKIRRSVLAASAIALSVTVGAGVTAAGATDDQPKSSSNSRSNSSSSYNSNGSRSSCANPSGYRITLRVVALTSDRKLICFDEYRPTDYNTVAITGVGAGETIIGIDFRPFNGKLYAVTNNAGSAKAYTVDPGTGSATLAFTIAGALTGTQFGVDFNPAADRLRIIGNDGQNLRIVPDGTTPAATPGATTVDKPLNYGGVTATDVTAAGYTNNDNDGNGTTPAGSSGTTLYDIDTARDQLVLQNPPNDGGLIPVGPLGVNASSVAGFDLFSTVRNGTTFDIKGLAALNVGGAMALYRIAPFSGKAFIRGALPSTVTDIAIPLNQL